MTSPTPVGFLDFFVLEASEYVDQLDGILLRAAESGADGEALQRSARALRGSATMAKLGSFADLAAGMERAGRALHDSSLAWSDGLRGTLIAAIDDCKILLRSVREWGDAQNVRARARSAELAAMVPLAARIVTPPSTETHDSYLATEAANIGAGLELLATRPSDRDAAANVLRRMRALRGIASVKDHTSLAEVLEAAEQTAQPLERGDGTLSRERLAVLQTSGDVLREIAGSIRAGARDSVVNLTAFNETMQALETHEEGADRVLPISDLFYADGGDTIVERAPHPPTTPAERFRLEAVSQGEHLRRIVTEARAATDNVSRERARRALRLGLRALQDMAESFQQKEVSQFVVSFSARIAEFESNGLQMLDEIAAMLAAPDSEPVSIGARIAAMRNRRPSGSTPSLANAAIAPASSETQERVAPAAATVGSAASAIASTPAPLDELLSAGIASLGALRNTPLSAPATIEEQPPVPIDTLLYRGRSAIERCVAIRDEARTAGREVDGDALTELFDLLDLALTN